MGNLWFVWAIGCNVEPMVEQNIHFPQTAKNIRTELKFAVYIRTYVVFVVE